MEPMRTTATPTLAGPGERAMIERALSEAHGNQSNAARLLGVSRDTLRYRMAKFKLVR